MLATHLPALSPSAATSPQDSSLTQALLPDTSSVHNKLSFSPDLQSPPSCHHLPCIQINHASILLWSHAFRRIWGCGPESHYPHNQVAPAGPTPVLLQSPHSLTSTTRLLLIPPLRSPQFFLLPSHFPAHG